MGAQSDINCHVGIRILPFLVTRIKLKGMLNAWVSHAQDMHKPKTIEYFTSVNHTWIC